MAEEQKIMEPAEEVVKKTTEEVSATSAAPASKKRKTKRSVTAGQLHVLATFNNTIVTFTDQKGAVLSWSSSGACGFRGSKKGTAYAAQVATDKAGQIAKQTYGLSKVDIFLKGTGLGRDAAVRSLQNLNIFADSLNDVTGSPHGGVRPRKARRV
jgi:small subunit ribosomal protein S11